MVILLVTLSTRLPLLLNLGKLAFYYYDYSGDNAEWTDFVDSNTKYWLKMITYWVLTWSSTSNHLHVVRYEDIVENCNKEVSKMLRFMGVRVEEDDVKDKLLDGYRYEIGAQ